MAAPERFRPGDYFYYDSAEAARPHPEFVGILEKSGIPQSTKLDEIVSNINARVQDNSARNDAIGEKLDRLHDITKQHAQDAAPVTDDPKWHVPIHTVAQQQSAIERADQLMVSTSEMMGDLIKEEVRKQLISRQLAEAEALYSSALSFGQELAGGDLASLQRMARDNTLQDFLGYETGFQRPVHNLSAQGFLPVEAVHDFTFGDYLREIAESNGNILPAVRQCTQGLENMPAYIAARREYEALQREYKLNPGVLGDPKELPGLPLTNIVRVVAKSFGENELFAYHYLNGTLGEDTERMNAYATLARAQAQYTAIFDGTVGNKPGDGFDALLAQESETNHVSQVAHDLGRCNEVLNRLRRWKAKAEGMKKAEDVQLPGGFGFLQGDYYTLVAALHNGTKDGATRDWLIKHVLGDGQIGKEALAELDTLYKHVPEQFRGEVLGVDLGALTMHGPYRDGDPIPLNVRGG